MAARQQAPTTAFPLPHVCHFYKKETKPFFPQKKVPEPISHLALSPPFGLTLKAHLRIYPCVLCTQNQQIYHLVLQEWSSPFWNTLISITYFQSITASSRSLHYSVSFFPHISVHVVCVSVYFLKHKMCSKCTHTHLFTHTQHLAKNKQNLPQEALSEVKLLLAFKPQGKCQGSPQ